MSYIQALEKASLNDLLNEEIFEHTAQDLYTEQAECNPELLQKMLLQIPIVFAQGKILVLQLCQDKLIDSKLAGLLCAGIKEFGRAVEQKTITQKHREKIDGILDLAHGKIKKLVCRKEIHLLIARSLLYILAIKKGYLQYIVL